MSITGNKQNWGWEKGEQEVTGALLIMKMKNTLMYKTFFGEMMLVVIPNTICNQKAC